MVVVGAFLSLGRHPHPPWNLFELGVFFLAHVANGVYIGHVVSMSKPSAKLAPEKEAEQASDDKEEQNGLYQKERREECQASQKDT